MTVTQLTRTRHPDSQARKLMWVTGCLQFGVIAQFVLNITGVL